MSRIKKAVIDYYKTPESRLFYRMLNGVKHMGYYPEGKRIKLNKAQNLMIEQLNNELGLSRNSFLLDAGCGEGSVAIYLASKYNFDVNGIDILDFNLKRAKHSRKKHNLEERTYFHLMDHTNIKFKDNFFDGVYTMESLVQSTDYLKSLQEFYRVLKPAGRLVLFEYSLEPAENIPSDLKRVREIIINFGALHSLPYFIHGSFPEILKKTGFRNVSVKDITARIAPFFKVLNKIFYLPYQFIKLFNAEEKFVNTTTVVECCKNIEKDYWRYNIVSANKPD